MLVSQANLAKYLTIRTVLNDKKNETNNQEGSYSPNVLTNKEKSIEISKRTDRCTNGRTYGTYT